MKHANRIFIYVGLILVICSLLIVIINNVYTRIMKRRIERVEQHTQSILPGWETNSGGKMIAEKKEFAI